jgi:hypothetical protein
MCFLDLMATRTREEVAVAVVVVGIPLCVFVIGVHPRAFFVIHHRMD